MVDAYQIAEHLAKRLEAVEKHNEFHCQQIDALQKRIEVLELTRQQYMQGLAHAAQALLKHPMAVAFISKDMKRDLEKYLTLQPVPEQEQSTNGQT